MQRLQVLRCTGLEDQDPFGSNDPYVVVKTATTAVDPKEAGSSEKEEEEQQVPQTVLVECLRTKVLEEKTNPKWEHAMTTPIQVAKTTTQTDHDRDGNSESTKLSHCLLIEVWDHDTASDDLIGKAWIDFDNAVAVNAEQSTTVEFDASHVFGDVEERANNVENEQQHQQEQQVAFTAGSEFAVQLRANPDDQSGDIVGRVFVRWLLQQANGDAKKTENQETEKKGKPPSNDDAATEKKEVDEVASPNANEEETAMKEQSPQDATTNADGDAHLHSAPVEEQSQVFSVSCDGVETITVVDTVKPVVNENGDKCTEFKYKLLSDSMIGVPDRHQPLVRAMRDAFDVVTHSAQNGQPVEDQRVATDTTGEDGQNLEEHHEHHTAFRERYSKCLALIKELHTKIVSTGKKTNTRAHEFLRNCECGLSSLLRGLGPLTTARPSLLQVVHHPKNSEIDVVRQANDLTGRISVERVPMTLPYLTLEIEHRLKVVRDTIQNYEEAAAAHDEVLEAITQHKEDGIETKNNKETPPSTPKQQRIEDQSSIHEDDISMHEKTSSAADGETLKDQDNTVVDKEETCHEDDVPAETPIKAEEGSPTKKQQLVVAEEKAVTTTDDEQQLAALYEKAAATGDRLLNATVAKHAAELDWAQWRENKAIAQFALEIYHHAEAGSMPIANESQRLQVKRLLQTVRINLSRLEESLKANRSRINSSLGITSEEQQEMLSAERVALYREVELLRGSEAVLEACVAEKKQLMTLLQQERITFNRSVTDLRDQSKDKSREASEAIAKSTQLRREKDALARECEELRKQLTKEKTHNGALHRHLDAVKEKRQKGLLGKAAPDAISPYDISAEADRPPKLVSEKESALMDRLYAKPLKKILTHETPPFKNKYHPPPVDEQYASQRFYYQRKDVSEKQQAKLRTKYKAVIADTSPKQVSQLKTKDELEANVDRMFRSPMKQREENQSKLFKEHILSHEPKMAKRAPEELDTIVQRFYTAGGKK